MKRYTIRNSSGFAEVIANDYEILIDDSETTFTGKAIERLAELEDKIEQGTLVDTEAYFIVEENQWAGKNRFLVCQNAIQLAVCDFCETKEEAEEVIKELQNG